VIRRADQHRAALVGVRRDPARDRAEPHRELFDAPETPQRLGERVDALARRGGVRRIERNDAGAERSVDDRFSNDEVKQSIGGSRRLPPGLRGGTGCAGCYASVRPE
jgi:hypothetical protein